MEKVVPLIILLVLLFAVILFNQRTRQKSARADQQRRQSLRPGMAVMTTSGLYATVRSVDPDEGSAILTISASGPAVEVKWSVAALREVSELPAQYRKGIDNDPAAPGAPESK